jgi:uncharacterized protein
VSTALPSQGAAVSRLPTRRKPAGKPPDLCEASAKDRLLSRPGEPLFYASWDNLLFMHYETAPDALQDYIPYPLDLYYGRAFVSLVAFTMRGMRPRLGGSVSALLFKPIATHHFLNVRTYVREKGEPGIYFMREWLSNRMAAWLGPWTFGLPYRFGRMQHWVPANENLEGRAPARVGRGPSRTGVEARPRAASPTGNQWHAEVRTKAGSFVYRAKLITHEWRCCEPGTLDEFLLERYTAFTQSGRHRRFFRIWHEPWQQVAAKVEILTDESIRATERWWRDRRGVGANYSPGVNVWMGWPHKIDPNSSTL